MIGVDDRCKVCGISCTRKQEDLARCQIDQTIKYFQPHVLPNMYMIDFIPVKLSPHDNIELESMDPLLKVLEVSVNKQNIGTLYENDQEKIYIRRDGSVEGPLKTSQVVEWCRVNFSKMLANKETHTSDETSTSSLHTQLNEITEQQKEHLSNVQESLSQNQHKIAEEFRNLRQDLKQQNALLRQQITLMKLQFESQIDLCNIL